MLSLAERIPARRGVVNSIPGHNINARPDSCQSIRGLAGDTEVVISLGGFGVHRAAGVE
jgi:hypothetical protein